MTIFTEGQDPLDQGLDPSQPAGRMPTGVPEPAPFTAPGSNTVIAAAFRQNNPVVSVLDAITRSRPDMTPVPGYDPVARLKGTKDDDLIDQSIADVNPAQTDARIAKKQAEQKDQQTLASSGGFGTIASIAAGATDPSWFIPILGEVKGAEAAGLAVRALRGMGEGAAKSAVSEAALQASQVTRTPTESANNIATNTLLMGLVGGGLGMLDRTERAAANDSLDAVRNDLSPSPVQFPPSGAPALRVARQMPDGSVRIGEPGQIHVDLMTKAELATDSDSPEVAASMGYANANGEFLTRQQALEFAQKNEPARAAFSAQQPEFGLDAATYNEATQPRLPFHDEAAIVPHEEIEPKTLTSSLSAAESDARTMKLSRILLPDNMMTALKETPFIGNAINYSSKVLMNFSPTLRVFSSDSMVAKRALGDMAETSLRFTQADSGITTARGGVPIDRMVKMQTHEGQLTGSQILRDAFVQYRALSDSRAPIIAAGIQDVRGQAPGKLSFDAFKSEVSGAMTAGDVHAIPEVQQAAQQIRSKVLEPVKQMAQRTMGPDGKPMLGEELEAPKGDKSFFPRVWNKQALAANYNGAKKIFADWLEGQQGIKAAAKERITGLNDRLQAASQKLERAKTDESRIAAQADHDAIRIRIEKEIADWEGKSSQEAKSALKTRAEAERARAEKQAEGTYQGKGERLTGADGAIDRAVAAIMKSPRDLTREELENRAAEIMNRINVTPDGRLPYDTASGGMSAPVPNDAQAVRGSLNARDFAIPTSLVRDFVNTDTEHVIAAHLRATIPDIHLTDRFGDIEMSDVMRRLDEEYDARLSQAKSSKQQVDLDTEKKAMVRDLAATRDRIRGIYGFELAKTQPNAARIANAARNFNLITDLGTSVFNRMTDSINAVYRHGFMNVMGDGYLPFFKSMVGMGEGFATASRQSMKDMGVGIDSAIGHLSHQYADVIDNTMPGSKFERALGWAADKSMMVNLHGPWTDGMKTVAGTVAAADFLRTAERVSKGEHTAADTQRLAQAGIDQNMAGRIWAAYSDGGGQEFGKGTHVANTADWADTQARDVFSAAIARDADMAVLTPGAEKPLWMSGPVVSLLGQYKSFVAAAHEKVLISNLQQMDARTLQGLIASVGMGMMSYLAYTLWSGAPTSDRPQDWIKEGVSRSAILGWFSEINSMQAKFTGGKTDMFQAIGADKPLSRRQSNGALSELLGPTYSKLEGIAGGVNDASHGTWTAMDTHKMRQAVFLQNLFLVRRLFDHVEDGVNENLGIKPLDRESWPVH